MFMTDSFLKSYKISKAYDHLQKARKIFHESGILSFKDENDFFSLCQKCVFENEREKEKRSTQEF